MSYVFLFPGQGSQKVTMGDYLKGIEVCDKTFAQADDALGFSITKLMADGPEEELTKTFHAQPAILTVAVAIGRYLIQNGVKPEIMAGHSLGEYACLVLSGAMNFEDAVVAVHKRGTFMQDAVPLGQGTMSAILGLDDAVVEEVCAKVTAEGFLVEPANYNCPGQLVISGTVEGVEKANIALKEKGAKRCIVLDVSAPFHSSMLKPASDNMSTALETVEVSELTTPYVANVDATVVNQASQIKERLVSQIDHPVRWTQSLTYLSENFAEATFVEVGAAKVVTGHLKKVNKALTSATTESLENIQSLIG